MVVGIMNGSKKARNVAKLANNTKTFGIMGGLAPTVGDRGGRDNYRLMRATNKNVIPLKFATGYCYMKSNNLLSKNPAGAGGVGKYKLFPSPIFGNSGKDIGQNPPSC